MHDAVFTWAPENATGIADKNGNATGFTMHLPSSNGSFKPELIEMVDSALEITTTAGILHFFYCFARLYIDLDTIGLFQLAENTADNAIGVGLDTFSRVRRHIFLPTAVSS